jgi:hypothetical protein
MALFGCAHRRPLDYSGSAGLLWAVNGGRLVELYRDWAVIDVPLHRSRMRGSIRRDKEERQDNARRYHHAHDDLAEYATELQTNQ